MFKTIQSKLITLFALLSLLPLAAISYLFFHNSRQAIQKKIFDQLISIRENKKGSIERYFKDVRTQIRFLAENPITISAMQEFQQTFHQRNPALSTLEKEKLTRFFQENYLKKIIDLGFDTIQLHHILSNDEKTSFYQYYFTVSSSSQPSFPYFDIHKKYHNFFYEFKKTLGYYDIFLVDNQTGYVVYTVEKESDFATNLIDGIYQNTNIGKLFRKVRNLENFEILLEDYDFYIPSYMEPALFMGCPIFYNGQNIGTVILQLPIDHIDEVMTGNKNWRSEGLGRTGESYIVGKDYKTRNNARTFFENREKFLEGLYEMTQDSSRINLITKLNNTILLEEVRTEAVKKALEGKQEVCIIKDYWKEDVLSAYSPLNIQGVEWVIIAEIDYDEAFEEIRDLAKKVINFLGILAVGIVIISVLIAKSISKPIFQLVEATINITKGKFGESISVHSKDEIGKLAFYFNIMSKTLKESRDRILKANQELKEQQEALKQKTIETQQKNEELLATEEELRQNMEELLAIQERLQASEIELRGRLDSINRTLAVLECSPDGRILDANTLFLYAVKYEKDELVGEPYQILLGKNYIPTRQDEILWEELSQGIPRSGEFKMYNRYQQEVWFNATYTPICDEHNKIKKILILATDITSQKLASLEFETSQRAFLKFNAVVELDLKGYIIFANNNFARLMGYDVPSELNGKHIQRFYDEAAFQNYSFDIFWNNLLKNHSYVGESKFLTKYHQLIWLHVSYSVVENIDEKPIKVILLARDITTQKQQELTIQEQLEKITVSEEELRQNQEELIAINENLRSTQEQLTKQNIMLRESAELIQKQSEEIQHINQKIIDSINYASRIQYAILGNPNTIEKHLADSFILFLPRDIVSGDFYWYAQVGNKKIIAAADCTGHGVPGAFMSLVGNTLLNKIVGEYNVLVPGKILSLLHQGIINALNQSDGSTKDGMDIALCVLDYDRHMLSFAGAKNPLVFIKKPNVLSPKPELNTLKGNKFSIGGMIYEDTEIRFETYEIPFSEILYCYIFSDGFEDQFGGSDGKKFLARNFRNLLYEIHPYEGAKKKALLSETFQKWIGTKYKQLDDILVIGFRP
ncbi:MAG: PAS domain-containing protein [Cytophagales bacterium]|nr:PAS domain-containing protein [Cytophagales bacterium]MDW8385151.1 PAS domain-containing protein [Flammeovirgaceae bacterium]